MPNVTAILALIAGTGGVILSQVGSLIPARKDFMGQVKLKREINLESLAASHYFLLKEFRSAGVEDFDNVMRGDGRTSRDYFHEHAEVVVVGCSRLFRLSRTVLLFRIFHGLLLVSTVALILLGFAGAILGAWFIYVTYAAIVLFVVELGAIFSLYALGDANEDQ